jgi:two-component system, NarL family, response regulator LiaR
MQTVGLSIFRASEVSMTTTTAKIKVLLADGQELALDGLKRILNSDSGIEVIGSARTSAETVHEACFLRPDVVVMDVGKPFGDGIQTTRDLREKLPDARILIMSLDEELVDEAIEAGASGYLTKASDTTEITAAVHQVSKGLCPIAPSVTRKLLTRFSELKRNSQAATLTRRETEVLRLVAEGKSSSEIARQMYLSISTVKREIGQVLEKLGVNDRPHAVSEAMRRRLI